jgi:hypothetical protein
MQQKFNITKNDIKNGEKTMPSNCAIAKAIKREMKTNKITLQNVSVLPDNVSFSIFNENTKRVKTYNARMPLYGKKFIRAFDSGLRVKPFELELNFK